RTPARWRWSSPQPGHSVRRPCRGHRRTLDGNRARGSARVSRRARRSLLFVGDLRLGVDHLLATVVAVGGDVVADVGLAGGRVGRQLLAGQRIVGAAHATLGRGDAGLLDSHGVTPGKTEKTSIAGPAGLLRRAGLVLQ